MNEELPGMLALQMAVDEQKWPHTMDAKVWAKEWMKVVKEQPEIALDEGCMVGWFANAIMAGYDTACLHSRPREVTMADNNYSVEEVGGLQKLICPVCKKEITKEQSLQYRIEDSKRIHYPSCD